LVAETLTIKNVARLAGVSTATITRVLQGDTHVSPSTRSKVQEVLNRTGYEANAIARSLRAGKTDVIGLLVPFHPWTHEGSLMRFVYSVADAARARGWNVMLLTAADGKSELKRVVRSNMVDGLILMEIGLHDERVSLVAALDSPAVLIGVPEDPLGLSCVDLDFDQAGQLCVEHLVGLGHRHLGFIGPPQGVYDGGVGFALRTERAVASRLADLGLPFVGVAAEPNREGAREAVRSLLAEAPDLTGLVVNNEGVLETVADVLRELGKDVPRDMSIAAIAREDIARKSAPPVTCVGVPADELGRRAVELLAVSSQSRKPLLLPATLVPLGSDSPPPPAES
jgi:DNA-binding LacI/PurR family transcriptional regulator